MAGASLLTLLDDIATVLDDVALMTKMAAKKTAGVLGDDLALNAEQVSGVRAERELPVVWAVAKGSALNKLILVPAALAISAVAPWLVTPLLMLGGLYLCYEGTEKVYHAIFHRRKRGQEKQALTATLLDPAGDLIRFEQQKIKGAIRTDFVLSAEIIVIALGTVHDAPFLDRFLVVAIIAALMTIGVYGLVAIIVKLDDLGLYLVKRGQVRTNHLLQFLGRGVLAFCPFLMKGLTLVGTAAMFLVGGGILVHGIPPLHHLLEQLNLPYGWLLSLLVNVVTGGVAGILVLLGANGLQRLRSQLRSAGVQDSN